VTSARQAYLLDLRALDLASERVMDACRGEDMDAAAIEAHFGLHAVYDLHETLFGVLGIGTVVQQDEYLAQRDGAVVGGLAVARGAKTHNLVTFAQPGGFGDLPYGMGPYGGGWLWKEHTWSSPKMRQRAHWYEARVRWRYLWNPLDEAQYWFRNQLASIPDASGAGPA
jgi:hypothetical protein